MTKIAMIFAGQGSQSLKMMDNIISLHPIIKKTFDDAKKITNVDYFEMLHEETPQNINKTINTQPIMLISSISLFLAWKELNGINPSVLAGHSLGEFSCLVASEVISFEKALELVLVRAKEMQNAVPNQEGKMAVILGIDDNKIIEICNEVQKITNEIVSGVNFNSPNQVVIAGNTNAVNIAMDKFKEIGAKRVLELPISVPSHCELMRKAAKNLEYIITSTKFNKPMIPIVQNVDASIHNDVNKIKELLIAQLYSPVLWSKSICNIFNMGINHFVESSCGKVLSGLNKRINDKIISYNLGNIDDFNIALNNLK